MKNQKSYTDISKANERFAFLQEAINFEIFLREGNAGQLTGEAFRELHRELAVISEGPVQDFDFDFIQKTQGQLAAARFEKYPGYIDWLREDFNDPADL